MPKRFSGSDQFKAIRSVTSKAGSAAVLAAGTLMCLNRAAGPYLAETGRVAFTALAVFGLLAAVAEAASPGFVINWVAPRTIVAIGLLTGLLSLWPSGGMGAEAARPTKKGLFGTKVGPWLSGVLALTFSVFAGLGAWYYFIPMAAARLWLSLAAAIIAGAVFYLLGRDSTYE